MEQSAGRDGAISFRALVGFTLILIVSPQTFVPALATLRIAFVAAAVAIGTYVFAQLAERRPIVQWMREMQLAAAIAGWAVLTVPLSYWPGGTVSFLLNDYFKALAIFSLLPHVVTTVSRLHAVAVVLSLATIPLAVSGVRQYLGGGFVVDAGVTRINGYVSPLAGNPNDLALTLNLFLPFTIALLLTERRRLLRVALLGIAALQAGAVVLTFSRSGFLALAAIGVIYGWRLLRRPEGLCAAAVLAIVLLSAPILPAGYADRIGTIWNPSADATGSSAERWRDTVAATHFVLRSPVIGAGAGMNGLALNEERGPFWKVVHNVYLQYAVELGLPGLILFLLLFRGCARSAACVRRATADPAGPARLHHLAGAILVSLIAFALAGFFHPLAYEFHFYYLGGLAVALRQIWERQCNHV